MKSNTMKNKIQKLIDDGNIAKETGFSRGSGIYDSFIAGTDYQQWLLRCIDFMELNLPNHHMFKRFMDAANNAYGNGVEYFDTLISILNILIESDELDISNEKNNKEIVRFDKIFISHASKDSEYVDKFVKLLNNIGIAKSRKNIFCSSLEGYNIPLGQRIYEYIKQQFGETTLVIFILSNNYYDSAACLNEMGATWIKSYKHVGILLPQFNFSEIEGAIDPTEICMKIDSKERLNSLKDDLTKWFELPTIDGSIWERDRDEFLENIADLSISEQYVNSLTRVDIASVKRIKDDKLQLELRFINNGQIPMHFQELEITLIDSSNGVFKIDISDDFLKDKIIYSGENRRELLIVDKVNSNYDYRKQKKWHTDSYCTCAF